MDYFKVGNCGWTIRDTGFGNRIQFWEIAFRLAQYNDFRFAVMVDGDKWKETKYLDFPYTKSSVGIYHQLQNLEKITKTMVLNALKNQCVTTVINNYVKLESMA